MSSTFPRPPRSSYPSFDALMTQYRRVVTSAAGRESTVGTSVEGRPIVRFDLGDEGKPTVLLTALMHGVEAIGSIALLDLLAELADSTDDRAAGLLGGAHWVVLPVVNPDAFVSNME